MINYDDNPLFLFLFSGICSSVTVTDGHPECVLNQNICIQMNEQVQEENSLEKEKEKVDIVENTKKIESGYSYVHPEIWSTKLNNLSVRSSFNVRSKLLRWSIGDVHGDLKNILSSEFTSSASSSSPSASFSAFASCSSSSSSSTPCSSCSSSCNVQNNDSTHDNGTEYCQKNKNTEMCKNEIHETEQCKDIRKIEIDSFNDKNKFDIIIAADCLFFKDFHEELIWVLSNSLKKRGLCFLLQPRRGNTMELFLEKIKSSLLFDILYVKEDYNTEVWKRSLF